MFSSSGEAKPFKYNHIADNAQGVRVERSAHPMDIQTVPVENEVSGRRQLFNTTRALPGGDESVSQRASLLSDFPPFSIQDPRELGVHGVDRSPQSKPGPVFGGLLARKVPLPTNIWCENIFLGGKITDETNKVFQIPYVVDTAGPIVGIRTHSLHLKGTDRSVIMEIEADSGVTMGSEETINSDHVVIDDGSSFITHVAVELEWRASSKIAPRASFDEASMRSPIVRGSPYTSMEYIKSTPKLVSQQKVRNPLIIDQINTHICSKKGEAVTPVLVNKEVQIQFENTDHTWIMFVSKPTEFVCTYDPADAPVYSPIPGVVPQGGYKKDLFELKAVEPMEHGMMRLALLNNCTLGRNPVNCYHNQPTDSRVVHQFAELLRRHADVYPTGKAHVSVAFPSGIIAFQWFPAYMSRLGTGRDIYQRLSTTPAVEILMYALPHHQDQLLPQVGSSNEVLAYGCVPTLQGQVCPVKGGAWLLQETLPKVTFSAKRPMRQELMPSVLKALEEDLLYEIPLNYRKGAGDTYFSGKMIAKLARIILVAEEAGYDRQSPLFENALDRLKAGTEIWINGSARSPFLYDAAWGGLISCGCEYSWEDSSCFNEYPNCPALQDAGQNFGNAFYNDHHFHYGYHIYAAAVIIKYDQKWGRKFHERVMLLIRDIANPSHEDPFFPTWRHKDWYLGSSWASGIVTTAGGQPFPNGRNEESSAEAIAAYESVALYGYSASAMFSRRLTLADEKNYETTKLVEEMGRLLMTTEIKSAQRYWHVRAPGFGVKRVYPDSYTPKVVGMLWSMLAEEQTWFGNQQWKSYGIQVLTITPASEDRDELEWVQEMFPSFNESCLIDPLCVREGWSVLVHAAEAELCMWKSAAKNIEALPSSVFTSAGGDGQSRSNSLWWIATRPCA
eukprot:gene6550-13248_t